MDGSARSTAVKSPARDAPKPQPIAHTPPPGGFTPQYLSIHLLNTATKGLGRLRQVGCWDPRLTTLVLDSGRYHDIGKATVPFYNYLAPKDQQVGPQGDWWMPHAIYGALALAAILTEGVSDKATARRILSEYIPLLYLIAHHHSGFRQPESEFCRLIFSFLPYFCEGKPPNNQHWVPLSGWSHTNRVLGKRDHKHQVDGNAVYYERLIVQTRNWFVNACNMELPQTLAFPYLARKATFAEVVAPYVTIRAAMGALTYGDSVDTSNFYGNTVPRMPPLRNLRPQVESRRKVLAQKAQAKLTSSQVCALRNAVYQACSNPPSTSDQFYLLCSPTGSAKTIGSMAFAGAVGAKQVIYLLPFLSIVEQVVHDLHQLQVADDLLIHVSVSNSDKAVNDEGEEGVKVYKNPQDKINPKQDWSHPLIVSTLERLSRVLVGKSKSDARRMLALFNKECVVVIDEVHSISSYKLYLYLEILKFLGCKVLMMSATAAAVRIILNDNGLSYVDLTPPGTLPSLPSLRKWRLEKHRHRNGPDFEKHHQVLSVYNTRRWAHESYERVRSRSDAYLITSRLCPEHRTRLIVEIRKRLKANHPCLVVATPTVEAGIDLSFPIAYRMAAPLIAVTQAGGRCNREGALPFGEVVIWVPADFRFGSHVDGRHDCPDNDYYLRARWMIQEWERRGYQVVSDAEVWDMEASLAKKELAEFAKAKEKAAKALAERRYGRNPNPDDDSAYYLDELCMIPKDELVSAVVDYDGAIQRLRQGRMGRMEVSRYSVEMKGPDLNVKVQEETIRFAGETEDSKVYVYSGSYDPKVGI